MYIFEIESIFFLLLDGFQIYSCLFVSIRVYFLCFLARVYFVLIPINECNGLAVENKRDVDIPNVTFPNKNRRVLLYNKALVYVSNKNKRDPIQTYVFPNACLFCFKRACRKQIDVIVSKQK